MSYQSSSFNLVQADIDAIKAAQLTIDSKLPFLITRDAGERKALFKLGSKSADFVQDANMASINFVNILPASFDKAAFRF